MSKGNISLGFFSKDSIKFKLALDKYKNTNNIVKETWP